MNFSPHERVFVTKAQTLIPMNINEGTIYWTQKNIEPIKLYFWWRPSLWPREETIPFGKKSPRGKGECGWSKIWPFIIIRDRRKIFKWLELLNHCKRWETDMYVCTGGTLCHHCGTIGLKWPNVRSLTYMTAFSDTNTDKQTISQEHRVTRQEHFQDVAMIFPNFLSTVLNNTSST